MTDSNITILGLGAMGARMAKRLLDAGFPLTVYNRTPERAAALVEAGARFAPSPRAAADGADIVIACVTADDASRALWLGEDGALAGLGERAVAVESSTLSPDFVLELAETMRVAGRRFVDAPVLGSRPQAEAGALVHLVGGAPEDVDVARPALAAVGGALHHLGPVGAGARFKLVANVLFGVQVAALGEALSILERGGVGIEQGLEVLGGLPITSPAMKGVGGLVAAKKWAPMFPIALVEKDFRYAIAQAEALALDAPVTRAVREVYEAARESGLGDENIHAVAKHVEPRWR